jgi:hypothetical protein
MLGMARVRGQGWFGEAPERPVFFVVLLPALARARLITTRKGDVRAAVSLTVLHLYTRRQYVCLYCLPWTAIEHHIINC